VFTVTLTATIASLAALHESETWILPLDVREQAAEQDPLGLRGSDRKTEKIT
jgi:hypothetical protein